MIKLFDDKIKMVKDKQSNFVRDFSGWQTSFMEMKRQHSQTEKRLAAIEE